MYNAIAGTKYVRDNFSMPYFLHVYLFLIVETNTVVGEASPPPPNSEYQNVKLQYY